ncbi:hypothetical protein JHK86_050461 [Glycine max]|nr:hypothetical protein JHK86_050461 [Glycine max]
MAPHGAVSSQRLQRNRLRRCRRHFAHHSQALGVAKPSVASYLSQEILAEQEADRVHGLPVQPPVKFKNMVVISLSMKLKEEHCSIGFLRPLTNQNKNPFSYGSMEAVTGLTQPNNAKPIADSSFSKAKPEDSLDPQFKPPEASQLLCHSLEGNASALTNFEVLDFLQAKGASKDPTRVIAKVAQSEYKYDLAKAEALNILNIGPATDFGPYPEVSTLQQLED